VARAAEDYARGEAELGHRGRAPVAAKGRGSVARQRAHLVRRRSDLADAKVVRVGDEEVAGRIEGDVHGGVELGRRGRAAVTRETTGAAGTRHRADLARRSDLADDAVAAVGDEEVARPIEDDTCRLVALGR